MGALLQIRSKAFFLLNKRSKLVIKLSLKSFSFITKVPEEVYEYLISREM